MRTDLFRIQNSGFLPPTDSCLTCEGAMHVITAYEVDTHVGYSISSMLLEDQVLLSAVSLVNKHRSQEGDGVSDGVSQTDSSFNEDFLFNLLTLL